MKSLSDIRHINVVLHSHMLDERILKQTLMLSSLYLDRENHYLNALVMDELKFQSCFYG